MLYSVLAPCACGASTTNPTTIIERVLATRKAANAQLLLNTRPKSNSGPTFKPPQSIQAVKRLSAKRYKPYGRDAVALALMSSVEDDSAITVSVSKPRFGS